MRKNRKKPRIYSEAVKRRHTTHWDIDYLPLNELDALYGREAGDRFADPPENKVNNDSIHRRLWIMIGCGALLLAVGVLLWQGV